VGLRIFGTHGQIYLEDTDCGVVNLFYPDGGHEPLNYRPNRGYYNELLNFYNALQGTEEIAVTPDLEIGDFRTVYAILQSIKDQDIVKVDRTPEYAMG
jgi:predicted dehydrogenase